MTLTKIFTVDDVTQLRERVRVNRTLHESFVAPLCDSHEALRAENERLQRLVNENATAAVLENERANAANVALAAMRLEWDADLVKRGEAEAERDALRAHLDALVAHQRTLTRLTGEV